MAVGQEAAEQLWQELTGGYSLNARLLALLEHPLDVRGQEAAKAMSQELSRVFMVSLFTLKPSDSSRVEGLRMMAPEATSIGQGSAAKDKRRVVAVLLEKRSLPAERVEEMWLQGKRLQHCLTRRVTDGENTGKRTFGTENFQGCTTAAHVAMNAAAGRRSKCSRRITAATPIVQCFKVTIVNEHTCHQVLPSQKISNATISPATSTTVTKNGAAYCDPAIHVGGNAQLENKIMTGTFTTVIRGAPSRPQPVQMRQMSDPASYVPPGLLEVSTGLEFVEAMVAEMDSPFPPAEAPAAPSSSPPPPVEASSTYLVSGGNITSMDPMTMEGMYFPCGPLFSPVAAQSSISGWDDASMAVVAGRWYTDMGSPWPHYP